MTDYNPIYSALGSLQGYLGQRTEQLRNENERRRKETAMANYGQEALDALNSLSDSASIEEVGKLYDKMLMKSLMSGIPEASQFVAPSFERRSKIAEIREQELEADAFGAMLAKSIGFKNKENVPGRYVPQLVNARMNLPSRERVNEEGQKVFTTYDLSGNPIDEVLIDSRTTEDLVNAEMQLYNKKMAVNFSYKMQELKAQQQYASKLSLADEATKTFIKSQAAQLQVAKEEESVGRQLLNSITTYPNQDAVREFLMERENTPMVKNAMETLGLDSISEDNARLIAAATGEYELIKDLTQYLQLVAETSDKYQEWKTSNAYVMKSADELRKLRTESIIPQMEFYLMAETAGVDPKGLVSSEVENFANHQAGSENVSTGKTNSIVPNTAEETTRKYSKFNMPFNVNRIY